MSTINKKSTLDRHYHQVSFSIIFAVMVLVVWSTLRLALWIKTGITQISFSEWVLVMVKGVWFDINTLIFMLAPCLLLSVFLPNSWLMSKRMDPIRWYTLTVVLFFLLFLATAEFIFWHEFTTRFNFIAVDYLIYTKEVIGNIRQSYPVNILIFIMVLISVGLSWIAKRRLCFDKKNLTARHRLILCSVALLLPVLSIQFSNIEQMNVRSNAYASELAGNGVFSFFAALRRNDLDYKRFYQTLPQTGASKILEDLKPTTSNLSRNNLSKLMKYRPKNVVLISAESLSAEYLAAYGDKQLLTPYLNKLMQHSLVFDRAFAIGTRTVRGLDALSVGVPPIPGQAIIHRPNNDNLKTLGEVLSHHGFATFFIYGGYGVFDNMNNYFSGNHYHVIDRTDFPPSTVSSENIWGVDDESLFNNSLSIMDKQTKPFFTHIMTTSNHRPYTFPAGRIDLAQGTRESAVKYTDYAIGKFLEMASTRAWFKDTLFVITADHCASVAGKTELPVNKYHIPLLFYAPELLNAAHERRMVSQIDIVPTLLDILNIDEGGAFYGQSLWGNAQIAARAFISNYQSLGYYKDDTLVVLKPKQVVNTYRIDPITLLASPSVGNKKLEQEAIAYYQTASRDYKEGYLKAKYYDRHGNMAYAQ